MEVPPTPCPRCKLIGCGQQKLGARAEKQRTSALRKAFRIAAWHPNATLRLRIDTGLEVYFCDPHGPWRHATPSADNGRCEPVGQRSVQGGEKARPVNHAGNRAGL